MDEKTIRRSMKHQKKLAWLAQNERALEQTYAGMWVAISDEGLSASGSSFGEAEEQALRNGHRDPLVVPIKAKEYQGIYLIRRCL